MVLLNYWFLSLLDCQVPVNTVFLLPYKNLRQFARAAHFYDHAYLLNPSILSMVHLTHLLNICVSWGRGNTLRINTPILKMLC